MVDYVDLPEVSVVAAKPAPFIPISRDRFEQPIPLPYRPDVPRINSEANRAEYTNLVLMYREVIKLDKQAKAFRQNIDYILSKLSLKEKKELSNLIKEIEVLEKDVQTAAAEADKQFKLSMDQLRLWNIWNQKRYKTLEAKFDVINVALSVLGSSFFRKRWEKQYGVARRAEISSKYELNKKYTDLLEKINPIFLNKIYPNFQKFPSVNRNQLLGIVNMVGAKSMEEGRQSNYVEILISDSRIPSGGSEFGHVAVNVGGVVYGRAPKAWDIREKSQYIQTQQTMRKTRGFVIQLSEKAKLELLVSIEKKIIKNASYGILDHSCSKEIIAAFGDIGLNVVDPRWSFGDVFSPADMANFLSKSKVVVKMNDYPKTK